MVPTVTVNVAVVLRDPTVTEGGAVTAAALLDSVTVAPPACDIVTVHVELPPDFRLVGLQVNPVSAGAGVVSAASEIRAAALLLFNMAVMVAV